MDDQTFIRLARNFIESMTGFVAVDNDGIITYMGKQYAEGLGYTPEQCVGRHVTEIIPASRMHIVVKRKKNEMGRFMSPTNPTKMGSICNRIMVYQDGIEDPDNAVGAMAFAVITPEQDLEKLTNELESLRRQNELLQGHLAQMYSPSNDLDEILGTSLRVRNMKDLIKRVAGTSVTVCILGETGTGKELVANAIHKLSKRSGKPFIKINCAAIPKDLMESELFGYEPGAFTGASRQGKIGKFELANDGTLLLDEIGELPLNLQAKLLRVLQANEVERVGGTSPIPINVRLLCSTNQNLQEMVDNGTFRADLFYRINTMEISVPALRDRLEDIPLLAARFIEQANEKNDLSVTGITDYARELLLSHSWPGNIRELEHSIERACVLCGSGPLEPHHFAALLVPRASGSASGAQSAVSDASLLKSQAHITERKAILHALDVCHGNKRAAAEMLGITRATLYNKLKKFGIS